MRILQVVHRYRPRLGGMENYVYNLRACLTEQGHQVDILTTDYKLPNLKREQHAFYCRTIAAPMENPITVECLQILRKNRYDVYHLHGLWFINTWIPASIIPKNKMIVTAHNASAGNSWIRQVAYKTTKPIISNFFRSSQAVICLSEKDKLAIHKEFGISEQKLRVIPNGVPDDLVNRCVCAREEFLCSNSLSSKAFRILYVGRIQPDKNIDFIISALNYLPDDVELIIAGSSEKTSYVEYLSKKTKAIGKRIRIFLDQPPDFIACLYKCADLFITLGELEGIPTTILESMAFGLPVIAYDAGGIRELFNSGGGVVLQRLTMEKLVGAILSYYENKSLRDKDKQTNIEKSETFKWSLVAKRIEAIYSEVLG